jgi:hypothetical protein
MSHPFFKNINWENLLLKKLEPLIRRIDENVKLEELFENSFDHTNKCISLTQSNNNIFEV